jgi:hypothetical protein
VWFLGVSASWAQSCLAVDTQQTDAGKKGGRVEGSQKLSPSCVYKDV